MKIRIHTTDPKVISIVFWIMITSFAVGLQLLIPKIEGAVLGKRMRW